jgi:hypothetical protein
MVALRQRNLHQPLDEQGPCPLECREFQQQRCRYRQLYLMLLWLIHIQPLESLEGYQRPPLLVAATL